MMILSREQSSVSYCLGVESVDTFTLHMDQLLWS